MSRPLPEQKDQDEDAVYPVLPTPSEDVRYHGSSFTYIKQS